MLQFHRAPQIRLSVEVCLPGLSDPLVPEGMVVPFSNTSCCLGPLVTRWNTVCAVLDIAFLVILILLCLWTMGFQAIIKCGSGSFFLAFLINSCCLDLYGDFLHLHLYSNCSVIFRCSTLSPAHLLILPIPLSAFSSSPSPSFTSDPSFLLRPSYPSLSLLLLARLAFPPAGLVHHGSIWKGLRAHLQLGSVSPCCAGSGRSPSPRLRSGSDVSHLGLPFSSRF